MIRSLHKNYLLHLQPKIRISHTLDSTIINLFVIQLLILSVYPVFHVSPVKYSFTCLSFKRHAPLYANYSAHPLMLLVLPAFLASATWPSLPLRRRVHPYEHKYSRMQGRRFTERSVYTHGHREGVARLACHTPIVTLIANSPYAPMRPTINHMLPCIFSASIFSSRLSQ